ncbi:MAG: hypothetical protein AB7G11_07600 [Phycisphaerales bacterium]
MARKRQIILMKAPETEGDGGSSKTGTMAALGTVREVVGLMADYNISPDGSGPEGMGDVIGMGRLYGPGFVAEIPTAVDEVTQVMVMITDEDFAWAVLMRLCRQLKWKMMDPESGRTFG